MGKMKTISMILLQLRDALTRHEQGLLTDYEVCIAVLVAAHDLAHELGE